VRNTRHVQACRPPRRDRRDHVQPATIPAVVPPTYHSWMSHSPHWLRFGDDLLEDPPPACPALGPRRGCGRQAVTAASQCCLPQSAQRRPSRRLASGAPSRGLHGARSYSPTGRDSSRDVGRLHHWLVLLGLLALTVYLGLHAWIGCTGLGGEGPITGIRRRRRGSRVSASVRIVSVVPHLSLRSDAAQSGGSEAARFAGA